MTIGRARRVGRRWKNGCNRGRKSSQAFTRPMGPSGVRPDGPGRDMSDPIICHVVIAGLLAAGGLATLAILQTVLS